MIKFSHYLLAIVFAIFSLIVEAKMQRIHLTVTQDGHLEMTATINGIVASFILDTGATGTVIDLKQLHRFGIEIKQASIAGVSAGDTENGQIETFPINIDNFSIGGNSLDISHIYANQTRGQFTADIAGLIGHDALIELKALVDLKSAQLLIPESQNDVDTLLEHPQNQYLAIELQQSKMGFSFVDIELNNHALRLLVDSGAPETVLDESILTQLNFTLHNHPTAKSIVAEGIELPMKVLKQGKLTIGEIGLPNDYLVSDFATLMRAINHQQQRLFVGVLGNKQMLELNTIVDVHNAKLYIKGE